MKRAVVLLSGGIDSSTTLAVAKSEGYALYALSFDYHQRHRRELESARMVTASLGVKRHLVIAFDLREIGGSALTSDMEVPKQGAKDSGLGAGVVSLEPNANRESPIPVTYVPARNTIFLSFALGWAEVLGAGDIFIGANAVDYSGYPDCRPGYLKAFEEMANLATKASVEGDLTFRINAPLLRLTKAGIIRKGVALGLDYGLTWSCYDPQRKHDASSATRDGSPKNALHDSPFTFHDFIPCGRCDSCVIRARGFAEAGMGDPLARP
jgi:7-cyano-7-deazaguanine synthase